MNPIFRFPILCLTALAGCAATEWSEAPLPPREVAVDGAPVVAVDGAPALRALLALALDRNPRIHAARARAAAAAEAPAVDGALPDPKVMLGWYATPVETRVGPQEFAVGIQQAVPFPSKLRARARLGRTAASRAAVLYEAVVRDVLTETVKTAHELAYLDAAEAATAELAPLVERYVAEGAAGAPLDEAFRAASQRAQLENDRVLLAEMRAAEAARLRALLDLPPDAPVGTPRVGAPPEIAAGLDELAEIARTHNHELRAAGIAVDAAGVRRDLAERERLPDFTIGYTRIFTDRLDLANPAGNGDDPDIVQFGVTLPLWVGKNRARVRQARALERAAALDRRDAELQLRARLARVWYEVGHSRRLVRLYEDLLVPRAETAARTAEDLAAAGKGTLAGTLETIAALHHFRLAAARARADHGRAVAELEALLGTPLEVTR